MTEALSYKEYSFILGIIAAKHFLFDWNVYCITIRNRRFMLIP